MIPASSNITTKHFRWLGYLTAIILNVFLLVDLPSPSLAKPLAAAAPAVTIAPSSVMIGEDFDFLVTFNNTGTDSGYGPFIDLVFPYTGQDGDDGIEYYSSSYLGASLEDDIQYFPDQGGGWGCVTHPWLRDNTGSYVDVCGRAGDQFVSIRLPFGSFTPDQPQLDITVNAHLSINADLNPGLFIYGRGGFMFGETPEDDWCCGDTPFAVPNGTDSTTWPATPVTPQVITFSKAYTGPGNTEDETSTGPNFPRQYTLTVDIASGQTLTNIEIQDQLPDNVQFIGIDAGGTTAGYTVTSLPSTSTPGGTLSLNYASGSGTVVVTYDFYIPELYDQDGDTLFDEPVIDPLSGDDVSSANIAWVDASWDPVDPRDPVAPLTSDATCPTCPPLHTLMDKSLAIQKSVAVVPGTGGGPLGDQVAPNAILEYTLSIQVSDYFTLDNLVVTDTISDGQHVLPASTFTPTVQVSSNPGAFGPLAFNSSNYEISCDYTGATITAPPPTECTIVTGGATGQTTLTFRLSDEINANLSDGTMRGGCVNPVSPFGLYSPCDRSNLRDGPTTATIIYRAKVLDQFVDDYPSGDISVDQGDELDNTVDVTGDVLDNTSGGVVGVESDDAAAGTAIGRETLSKSIYAINGETNSALWDRDALGRVRVNPGDVVTYELEYDLLTSDVEELTFDDYFPLPVFDVTDPDDDGAAGPSWTFSSSGGIPAPGVVGLLLPGDTFYQYMTDGLSGGTGTLSPSTNNPIPTQDPVITADGLNNKINIYYADYDDTRNQSKTVDLLISITVSDDPFADGLFLTNMAHAFEGSTNAGTNTENAIIQFVLGEPVLVSTKGIIWSSNADASVVFDPLPAGPVGITFQDPSFAPRWTGTPGIINSSGLAANPIDSDLSGVDASDTVTFAITIENQGSSINGAFDIQLRDMIDTAFYQVPATGADLNLQVYYGDGTGPIAYRSIRLNGPNPFCTASANADDCGLELFNQGIELIDPVGAGVCSAHDPNLGNNVILITYDLVLRDDVNPGQALNTSSVFHYAGSEGGPNHLEGVNPLEDDATVDVIGGLEKTLVETEIVSATNVDDFINDIYEAVIGELVTYRISAIVPEGEVPGARLVDHLDGGLAFVSCDAAVIPNPAASVGISTDFGSGSTTDFSSVCPATEASGVSNNGQDIVFDLGNLVNSDRNNTTEERIVITYQVVVLNVSGNQAGTLLDNQVDFTMNAGSGDVVLATADAQDVTVIEPAVITEKYTPAGTTGTSTSGDAGDPVSYTITLSNPSTPADTDAFDVEFNDSFPMCPDPTDGSAVRDLAIDSQSGGATFILTGDNTAGWQLSATYDGAPGTPIDFAPGETATVDLSGTLAYCVTPGLSVDNTGNTTWTSLSGDYASVARSTYNPDALERTGGDGVNGALNDYASQATASAVIVNPTNTKYIISTSEAHTGLVNGLENLAIGEIVRFRLVSVIPEGTSPNFQIRDLLPGGLIFLNDDTSVVAFVSDGGITSSPAGTLPVPAVPNICNQVGSTADASTPVMDPANCTLADNNVSRSPSTSLDGDDVFAVPGRDVYFKLGDLVNNDSDADSEYVVIEFNALAHNFSTNQNDFGDTVTNQSQVYITGSPNGGLSTAATLRVAEPVISVTKSLVPPLPVDAGDPIQYEIVFSNAASGDAGATAYDLELTDTFDAYLEALTISSVSTTQGGVCVGDGAGTTAFTHSESLAAGALTVDLSCLDPGESVTVNVTGNVVDNVPAGTTLLNSAVGTGTSLEGANGTTGNSTGSDTPGASGLDTGERDGSDSDTGGPDDYYDAGTANHSLAVPVISKSVEPPGEWTIGESFTYDLVITLPEGVTPDMVVYDDIPDGLEFVSYNLITTTAGAGSLLVEDFDGTLPSPVVTAAGGSGGDLELDFGDTTTNEEYPNNTNNNSFQVQITVQVLNIASNQNGVVLTNQGELRYSSGTTATGTVDIEIIEPVLNIAKTVDDDTPGLGQTLTYSLVISHDLDGAGEDSQSDAFNVHITDTLPAGLSNLTNITTSSTGNCASGFDTSGSSASVLDVAINEIPYSLPAPGCVVTITFDATVDSPPDPNTPALGSVIDNTAEITWTSLLVSNGQERSGDGIAGNVDDYETADTQAATITNPELRVTKDDGVGVYIPGDSVTYTILVENIGNADAVNALVEDSLPREVNPPNDLMVSSWDWVCAGSTGGASGCTGSLGLSADFSDLVNLPAGASITYQVTANILSSAEGDLVNTATISMPAGIIEPTPADNTATDTDIQESHADLSVTKDDGVTIISPGEVITYTIVVSNISPSDVSGAVVGDLIPAEIDSWTWDCSAVPPTGGASGCDGVTDSTADFNDTVNLPASSSITYQVTARTSPSASGTLTNQVTIAVPTGVIEDNPADNTASDADGFPTHTKTLTGVVHGVAAPPDVAIGEILIYEITLAVPDGTLPNLHLIDSLDQGLAFLGCDSITAPGLTTSAPGGFTGICGSPVVSELPGGNPEEVNQGRRVDYDFGTLINSSGGFVDLVLRYQVVVLDSLGNQSVSTPPLNNDAEWVWDSGQLSDQAVGVTILEPDLTISKSADPITVYPGQVTTFTLVVEHSASSQTSAYDVELTDIIPADLIYQPPIRHVSGQAPTTISDAGDPTLVVTWDEFLNNGVNSVIEIDVMLDPAFNQRRFVQTITNDASLSWSSLPGDFSAPQSPYNTLSTERRYDPLSNIDIYSAADGARIRIPRLPDTGFAPGRVTDLPAQPPAAAYRDLNGLRLWIPDLGISLPIVSVPNSQQGYDLTWLGSQAGWLEGTAYPSWKGNTVITGHAYLPSGLPGPFVDLDQLVWGDELILYANGYRYTYQVINNRLVSGDDLSILGHKDQDWLTLFTCKEYSDNLGGYLWRQVVQAVLIEAEKLK